MYFFTSEACVPMRATPNESAEMVSQLVFGDIVRRKSQQDNWIEVHSLEDGYEGWVTAYMLSPITEAVCASIASWVYAHTADCMVGLPDGTDLRVPLGAKFPIMSLENGPEGVFSSDDKKWYMRSGSWFPILPSHLMKVTAKKFINVPYLWGGKCGFGIDCSGFAQAVYRMHGLNIPRDTSVQIQYGMTVTFENKVPGDLVFFSKPGSGDKVSHVGIVLENDEVIHSSGKVRIDKLNLNGLFSYETQSITHSFICIKHFITWDTHPSAKL